MAEIVTVICDGYFTEDQIRASVVCDDIDDVNIITIDREDIDQTQSTIASLSGAVVCMMGPGAFGFERSQLFHFLARNKQLHAFLPRHLDGLNIGKWTWVSPEVSISASARIGSMVYIGSNAVISANVTIGNFSWISEFVHIGVGAEVQKHVTIHHNVRIGAVCRVLPYTELRQDVFNNEQIGLAIDSELFNVRATIVNVASKK